MAWLVLDTTPAMLRPRWEGSWKTSIPITSKFPNFGLSLHPHSWPPSLQFICAKSLGSKLELRKYYCYLKCHFLHHGGRLLLVGERPVVDDLTGHWQVYVAQLLDGGVAVVSGSWHDHHHDLNFRLNVLPQALQVGLRPVVGKDLHVRSGHFHPHLRCQLGHVGGETAGNVLVLVDVEDGPLLQVNGHQHVVVGGLPPPVRLAVDADGRVLAEQQLLCGQVSSLQLNTIRGKLEVPVEEDGARLGGVVHVLGELLESLQRLR